MSIDVMNIGAVLHKIGSKNNVETFLSKLRNAPQTDVLIGPDYSLANSPSVLNTKRQTEEILNQLLDLSAQRKGQLIVPGTLTYEVNDRDVAHIAPVLLDGVIYRTFQKKSDDGEGKLAETVGKIYSRGKSGQEPILFQGKKMSVGICGDWGRVPLIVGDVDLVLAYDRNAGFHPHLATLHLPRKTVICDGYSPKAIAVDYDPRRDTKQIYLEGKLQDGVEVFEL